MKIEVGKQYKRSTIDKIIEVTAIGNKRLLYKVIAISGTYQNDDNEYSLSLKDLMKLYKPYTPPKRVWINFYKYPNGYVFTSKGYCSKKEADHSGHMYDKAQHTSTYKCPVRISCQEVEVKEGEGL